jgi:penicillin-binding protein 2
MIAAHRAGIQDSEFTCSGSGYVAAPGAKAIFDDGGPGEVHGKIGIDTAYEVSCNQYFAQMAVKLGPERLAESARLVGIGAYNTPEEAVRGRKEPQIWNASTLAIQRALAPREATIVTGPKISKFDLALEGYGQGYAGQMTPFQMALLAATVGNVDGKLMKPKIEFNRQPEAYNQVVTPQIGAALRSIMGLVTGGPSGTARGVFAPVTAAGITTGGKTGTAQKDVPLYDKSGRPITKLQVERDRKGNVISQREVAVFDYEHPRIDGWFLCIAPLDKPQIAMSVIIEGGGYGSKSAAPVAAALVLKARELGLLSPNSPPVSAPSPKGTVRKAPVQVAQQ